MFQYKYFRILQYFWTRKQGTQIEEMVVLIIVLSATCAYFQKFACFLLKLQQIRATDNCLQEQEDEDPVPAEATTCGTKYNHQVCFSISIFMFYSIFGLGYKVLKLKKWLCLSLCYRLLVPSCKNSLVFC